MLDSVQFLILDVNCTSRPKKMVIYLSIKAILILSITYIIGGTHVQTPQNVRPQIPQTVLENGGQDSQEKRAIQPDEGRYPAVIDELLPSTQSAKGWPARS